jgi:hypothetical protein
MSACLTCDAGPVSQLIDTGLLGPRSIAAGLYMYTTVDTAGRYRSRSIVYTNVLHTVTIWSPQSQSLGKVLSAMGGGRERGVHFAILECDLVGCCELIFACNLIAYIHSEFSHRLTPCSAVEWKASVFARIPV